MEIKMFKFDHFMSQGASALGLLTPAWKFAFDTEKSFNIYENSYDTNTIRNIKTSNKVHSFSLFNKDIL